MVTGKQYMQGLVTIKRRIRLLKERIERFEVMASGVGAIRYDKERVQTSPTGDRITEIVANIIESTEELKSEIVRLQEYEKEAETYLIQLDEQYERVLKYHYIDSYDWPVVAELMRYTNEKYVYEVKDKALTALDEILKTTY